MKFSFCICTWPPWQCPATTCVILFYQKLANWPVKETKKLQDLSPIDLSGVWALCLGVCGFATGFHKCPANWTLPGSLIPSIDQACCHWSAYQGHGYAVWQGWLDHKSCRIELKEFTLMCEFSFHCMFVSILLNQNYLQNCKKDYK